MYEIKPTNKPRVMVHGAMKYKCIKCKKSWWMFLEKGLEDGAPDSKPVPFCIRCTCGGTASDVSGVIRIPGMFGNDYEELPKGESYFANDPEKPYGIPKLIDRRLKLFAWV